MQLDASVSLEYNQRLHKFLQDLTQIKTASVSIKNFVMGAPPPVDTPTSRNPWKIVEGCFSLCFDLDQTEHRDMGAQKIQNWVYCETNVVELWADEEIQYQLSGMGGKQNKCLGERCPKLNDNGLKQVHCIKTASNRHTCIKIERKKL